MTLIIRPVCEVRLLNSVFFSLCVCVCVLAVKMLLLKMAEKREVGRVDERSHNFKKREKGGRKRVAV